MDIWILSQYKKSIIPLGPLYIDDTDTYLDREHRNEERNFEIYTYSQNRSWYLGEYKTEARALEVIDEIKEILMLCIKSNGNEHLIGTSCYVYEMPKE